MLKDHFFSVVGKYAQPSGRIILALSGGADSRVMLDLLAQYRSEHPDTECCAVHVHHGLSSNADNWAELCGQWCSGYGLNLALEKVILDLGARVSTEQEAREKRYEALSKHIGPGDLLLTGQHSGDQLETFLLAMKRGSGPKGLSAMPESTSFALGRLVRPLLSCSRESILEYATTHQLSWIEDESNNDRQFDRNFLRHEVIPVLKKRWSGVEQAVLRSASLCAQQEEIIAELLNDRLAEFTDSNGAISVTGLSKQSDGVRDQIIRLWLGERGSLMPSQKQLSLIWQEVALAREDANPKLKITSGEIRRFRERLYFVTGAGPDSGWKSPLLLDNPVDLPANLGRITLTEKRSGSPFSLRAPCENERVWVQFSPEGLIAHPAQRGHKRKLKKLFQEYGVPSWQRTRTPLIMYGDKLAMVAGLFVCKDFTGDDCEICWDKV